MSQRDGTFSLMEEVIYTKEKQVQDTVPSPLIPWYFWTSPLALSPLLTHMAWADRTLGHY